MNLISLVALVLAVQTPALETDQQSAEPAIASLDQLPIEESTAMRCGVAFAVVQGWQERQDPRGKDWPDLVELGGREFFVIAAAKLMDERGIDRATIKALTATEVELMLKDNGEPAKAIMPACLLLLKSMQGT